MRSNRNTRNGMSCNVMDMRIPYTSGVQHATCASVGGPDDTPDWSFLADVAVKTNVN